LDCLLKTVQRIQGDREGRPYHPFMVGATLAVALDTIALYS